MLRSLLKSGKYSEAYSRASAWLTDNPAHTGLLSILGSASYHLGRLGQAREYIERAIAIKPDSDVLRKSLEKIKRKMSG